MSNSTTKPPCDMKNHMQPRSEWAGTIRHQHSCSSVSICFNPIIWVGQDHHCHWALSHGSGNSQLSPASQHGSPRMMFDRCRECLVLRWACANNTTITTTYITYCVHLGSYFASKWIGLIVWLAETKHQCVVACLQNATAEGSPNSWIAPFRADERVNASVGEKTMTLIQYGDGSKPCTPSVHIKIAGLKWMFIPLKMVSIGIDPYPYIQSSKWTSCNRMTTFCHQLPPFFPHVYWLSACPVRNLKSNRSEHRGDLRTSPTKMGIKRNVSTNSLKFL